MKTLNVVFFVIITAFFCSCDNPLEPYTYGIDDELRPHVDKFFEEAAARGIVFKRGKFGLTVRFKHMRNTQGMCIPALRTIYINPSSSRWNECPESLVFHELGHLYLKRGHLNDTHNGICISIMSNQQNPVYVDSLSYRRLYYINELFNEGEPLPKWML